MTAITAAIPSFALAISADGETRLTTLKLEYPAPAPGSRPLADKLVLITGASRGLGRAIALAAAAAGATTLLLARDGRALEKLADEIEAAGGAEPSLVPLNLENATVDHYAEVAGLIRERWGRLDGLVLNAGLLGDPFKFSAQVPLDEGTNRITLIAREDEDQASRRTVIVHRTP